MSWLQQKYIGLMSNQFAQFKRKSNTLYNLRCPECGDSQRNKFKARGYLYQRDGKWFYKCHNCSYSVSFGNFAKKHSPELYKQYLLELISESDTKELPRDDVQEEPEIRGLWPLKQLKKISQLEHFHTAKLYIAGRKIPNPFHAKLYYCPDFVQWTNSIVPDKLKQSEKKDKRIIIPLIDKGKNLFGFQGRALDSDSKVRYITIIINSSMPKVFGLDAVDVTNTVYVFEGPFDSMFIPNSIAVCGSDIAGALAQVKELNKDKVVVVFDNERRNPEILKSVEKCIEAGYNVCLWPDHIKHKDINDMVLSGMSTADIKLTIDANTHKGLSAKLALSVFRR